jgi:hypothetical protein
VEFALDSPYAQNERKYAAVFGPMYMLTSVVLAGAQRDAGRAERGGAGRSQCRASMRCTM